MKTLHSFCCY